MTTYIIPEEVIGIPLLVPDTLDQFEIDEDGGPNGGACLLVKGNISAAYMAFQNAPILSVDMFRAGKLSITGLGNVPRAMSVFLKVPSGTSTGTLLASHYLGASNQSGVFSLCASGTADVVFNQGYSGGSPGFTFSRRIYTQTGLRNDAWHLLVVNTCDQGGSGLAGNGIFMDLNSVSGSNATGGNSLDMPENPHTSAKMVIGSYSSSMPAFAGEWRIAKLAFYPKYLSLQERAMLYTAITEGAGGGFGPDVNVTCTINKAPSQADPATGSTVTFHVTFSVPVTGFGIADINISGTAGATTVSASGVGSTYIVTVSGMTSPGTVIASIPGGVATSMTGGTNSPSTSTDNSVSWS